MKWNDIGDMNCSVARTLSVIGDRWTMLILRDVFLGIKRFDDMQKRLGVTRHILANRLGGLVENGILEKYLYRQRPARHEYRLTDKGQELLPVMLALMTWGDKWMDEGRGPPVDIFHMQCGAKVEAACTCPRCGGSLTYQSVDARRGPGWRASA